MSKLVILLLNLICLSACAIQEQRPVIITATSGDALATIVREYNATSLPPLSISNQTGQSTAVLASPLPAEIMPCVPSPDDPIRPQYLVNAVLDWETRSVEIEQELIYTNTTGVILDRLLFEVEPNRQRGYFNLHHAATTAEIPPENIGLDPGQL
ncbi:MAG TPA: hypothetical protein VJZ27_18345 [Aggregatilineales bacterium]|nr:hypothetical protein [Aggregatilineales bacterium]